MELKSHGELLSEDTQRGSNRTFMELKYITCSNAVGSLVVLIVPLWN